MIDLILLIVQQKLLSSQRSTHFGIRIWLKHKISRHLLEFIAVLENASLIN